VNAVPVTLWVAALVGMPLVLLAFRKAGFGTLDWTPRLALWALAAALIAVAHAAGLAWMAPRTPPGMSIVAALLAVVTIFACMPLLQRAQGAPSEQQRSAFAALATRPFAQRLFIVLTAAVVEEVLYRGLAIGLGQQLLGSLYGAAAISLVAFTLGHLRWGLAHLAGVAVAGAALTVLYVGTGSLVACIVVHFIVDAIGVLLLPVLLARKGQLPPSPEKMP
jgi:membrane protease YdiL (CAAX protease family)